MKLLKCEYFLDSFLLNPSITKCFTGDFPVFVLVSMSFLCLLL